MAEGGDDLLGSKAIASMFRVSTETARRWFDQGIFSEVSRTAGGHRRVPRREAERVLAELARVTERSVDHVTAGRDYL